MKTFLQNDRIFRIQFCKFCHSVKNPVQIFVLMPQARARHQPLNAS